MKFLILALTSLFVSFMPLQAAYAQGTDGTVSAGCVTVEQVLSPENLAILEKNGGSNVAFSGDEAQRFLKGVEAQKGFAPFTIDSVLVIIPNPESFFVNVGWFKAGCMVNSGNLPAAYVKLFQNKI